MGSAVEKESDRVEGDPVCGGGNFRHGSPVGLMEKGLELAKEGPSSREVGEARSPGGRNSQCQGPEAGTWQHVYGREGCWVLKQCK